MSERKAVSRAIHLLELWSKILPHRVAVEDLGGYIEYLQCRSDKLGNGKLILTFFAALLWTGTNALRLSGKGWWTMISLILLYVFAGALYGYGAVEYLIYAEPSRATLAQVAPGVLIACAWFVCALAVWRNWRQKDILVLSTAAATAVHAAILSSAGIMSVLGVVVSGLLAGAIIFHSIRQRRYQAN